MSLPRSASPGWLPGLRWRSGEPRPDGLTSTCAVRVGPRSLDAPADDAVLGAVRQRGADAPLDLEPRQAFVAWDEERRRLFAARDPLGAEGLFFRQTAEGLRVAGSATELLDGSPSTSDLDREGLAAHLCGGVPAAEATYFRDVRQVPPGSILVATANDLRVHTYWQPELLPCPGRSDDEWEETLREVLASVLRVLLQQLDDGESQPPRLGLTLSAGLDSGALAATLARLLDEPGRVTALRWTAPELPESDEGPLSAEVARRCGFDDAEIRGDRHWTFCSPLGVATEPDSPLAVPFVGLWDATFRAARKIGIRHLLTGSSGDHLLGGNVYSDLDLLLTGRWLRSARSLGRLRRARRLGPVGLARHLAQLVYWSAGSILGGRSRKVPPWIHRSAPVEPTNSTAPRALPGRRRHLELLRDPVRAETLRVLGLQAARHGVRLHHPLLDRKVFEVSASMPSHQLFRDGFTKHVVRRAFRHDLPRAITRSPGKILPTGIVHRGLREREVGRVQDLLTDMRAADLQLVEPAVARREYESYLRGEQHNPSALWPTLTLEAWLRQHVS